MPTREIFRTTAEAKIPAAQEKGTFFGALMGFWNTFNPLSVIEQIRTGILTATGLIPNANFGQYRRSQVQSSGPNLFLSRRGFSSEQGQREQARLLFLDSYKDDPLGHKTTPFRYRQKIVIR